ncbi:MAG: asparaginase [Candidatus Velamenicoccus archaeovorus]
MTAPAPLVRVVRSGFVESVHLGHVAVCDVRGRVVARLGDPMRPVFARSSMKPIQGAVSLSLIGEELPGELVAVMCASHNGEDVHVREVRRLLARAGLGPSALRNPPGWPLDARSMARAGRPSRLRHNCSGKHAGMLMASRRSGWDLETYTARGHPLQRRVTRAVLAATGLERVGIGVDGCGVPVHALPLASMATLYARLGRPEHLGRLEPWARAATEAMRSHPYLVGGRARADTALMRVAPGILVKVGAEALHCAAIPEAGLGVAVKVHDGGERASGPALIRALELLGALSAEQLRRLERHARRPVTGGDRPVGAVEAGFELRRR